jgi:hypothetical protein
MIEQHPDLGPDPLAGKDPHPREQIDLWPLHDARQELLEEIVSQPGPGNAAAASARRFLVPVGIAAAIAVVAGAAWFVVSDDDPSADKDDQVVASSESPTQPAESSDAVATDDTSASTPAAPTDQPRVTPFRDLKKGDQLTRRQCRQLQSGDLRSDRLQKTLTELSYIVREDRTGDNVGWYRLVRVDRHRWIGVDKHCAVVSVRRVPSIRGQH